MQKTASELASIVNGSLEGNPGEVISSVAGLREAQPGQISFLAHSRYTHLLGSTEASAILVGRDIKAPAGKTIIRVDQASVAFGRVVALFAPPPIPPPTGIHPQAVISPAASVDPSASVQAFAVIEAGARIGAHTIIQAGCYVGAEAVIGQDCLLYPNVTIRERCVIGNRVILHAGAVIGADGFGYDMVDGRYQKVPQVGIVQIDDDVEIGANATVDRARFGRTWIKKGVKIDNLVQVAHNVVIGENTAIAAQAGISGSTVIGKNVIIAGQVGTVGHISIGDKAILGAQSGINHDIPAGQFVFGYPAQEHREAMKTHGMILRLPKMIERLRKLEEQVSRLSIGQA
ncbi:MAG: UDP-3-O-(3-hydroxymyristoyl)glucosamine N-acyltransferase [Verrucomicrobiae bacterium]|nr:UDP-3-O-(3-hydroxymyristoyl)glucosamine N-acyltransferase [Verrucomicrobiae bacterium]